MTHMGPTGSNSSPTYDIIRRKIILVLGQNDLDIRMTLNFFTASESPALYLYYVYAIQVTYGAHMPTSTRDFSVGLGKFS